MQHLSMETLARLADEAPGEEEARHLAACDTCRGELEEMRAQIAALARLPILAAPRHGWPLLERRLRAEGALAARPARRLTLVLRIAASLAIFAAGGVAGARLSASGGAEGAGGAGAAVATLRTAGEAEAAVRRTEAAYLAALTRYAELSGNADPADPVNRLAALEGIVLTTRAALEEAPADPVINGYHLTALSQREAILRRIGRTTAGEQEWF